MRRTLWHWIVSAALISACADVQAQSNGYGQSSGQSTFRDGTRYTDYGLFEFPFRPYRIKFSGRAWFQDQGERIIIAPGHERERGGILHRLLEVDCGRQSIAIPLEPGPPNLRSVAAGRDDSVLGVIVESGYPEKPQTLVSLLDGSAGVYSTNAGRISYAGRDVNSTSAATNLLAKAGSLRSAFTKVTEFPFPQKAHTKFYIVTPFEVLTAEVDEQALRIGEHPLSPLFQAAERLIAELRANRAAGDY